MSVTYYAVRWYGGTFVNWTFFGNDGELYAGPEYAAPPAPWPPTFSQWRRPDPLSALVNQNDEVGRVTPRKRKH